jgi:hypothetical protein
LNDHAVVAEFTKLIFLLVNQTTVTVGMFVEGGVGFKVEFENFIDYAESAAAEDFATFEF